MARDDFGDSPKFCKHCGSVSFPRIKTVKEGDPKIGCLLTFLMILPGLLYFAFRMRTEEFWICGVCDRRGGLIPTDSPVAREAINNQSKTNGGTYCTSCGKSNGVGAAYCSGCGHKLQAVMNVGPVAENPPAYDLTIEPHTQLPKKAGEVYVVQYEHSLWSFAGTLVRKAINAPPSVRITVGIVVILALLYYLSHTAIS